MLSRFENGNPISLAKITGCFRNIHMGWKNLFIWSAVFSLPPTICYKAAFGRHDQQNMTAGKMYQDQIVKYHQSLRKRLTS